MPCPALGVYAVHSVGNGICNFQIQTSTRPQLFPAQIDIVAQLAITGSDTRTPPSTVQYVASTGDFTAKQGSEFVVHGQ